VLQCVVLQYIYILCCQHNKLPFKDNKVKSKYIRYLSSKLYNFAILPFSNLKEDIFIHKRTNIFTVIFFVPTHFSDKIIRMTACVHSNKCWVVSIYCFKF